MRLVILGGPKTGKTTLAKSMTLPVKHTDDVMHLGWSEASEMVATWFDEPGPWVIEGVACARALRKWLAANEGQPCDTIIICTEALVPLTTGQRSMAKGVMTVLAEILPELTRRGVEIQHGA